MKNILIVDDEAEIREILREELSELSDVHPLTAAGGREAIDLISQNTIDLIISDYRMPGFNGVEMFKILKERGHQIPIIFLTACSEDRLKRETWVSGSSDFLEKPVDMKRLKEAVRATLFAPPAHSSGDERETDLRKNIIKRSYRTLQIPIERELYEKFEKSASKDNLSVSSWVTKCLKKCA